MAATMTTETPPPHRRAFTLPTRLNHSSSPSTPPSNISHAAADENATETLFTHDDARIYKFPAPQIGSDQKEGALPWTRPNERLEAVGVMRLSQPRGQTATFLSSGNLLLSLMPRSQCWCVDGQSKFALRLHVFIYRIELPYKTDHERASVEDFKKALGKALRYERTACPFKRSFKTEACEDDSSPLVVGKLKRSNTKAKKWAYDEGWRLEGTEKPTPPERRALDFRRRRRRSGSSSAELSDGEGRHSGADSRETSSTRLTSMATPEGDPYVVGQVKKLESARTASGPPLIGRRITDPFVDDNGEASSLQRDIAPLSQYMPLGAINRTLHDLKGDGSSHHSDRDYHELAVATKYEEIKSVPQQRHESASMPNDLASDSSSSDSREELQSNLVPDEDDKGSVPEGEQSSPPKLSLKAKSEPAQDSRDRVEGHIIPSATPKTPSFFIVSPAIASLNESSFVEDPISSTPGLHSATHKDIAESPRATPSILGTVAECHTTEDAHIEAKSSSKPEDGRDPSQPSFLHNEQESPTMPAQLQPADACSGSSHTLKPRPSQMLRDFRSRRPATPVNRNTATTRGLSLDLAQAHYLRNDPLPPLPYGNANQSVVGKAMTLLMGPPSGLVAVMVQIASRIAGVTASLDLSSWIQGDWGYSGEAAYHFEPRDRWIPGSWDESEPESERTASQDDASRTGVARASAETSLEARESSARISRDID